MLLSLGMTSLLLAPNAGPSPVSPPSPFPTEGGASTPASSPSSSPSSSAAWPVEKGAALECDRLFLGSLCDVLAPVPLSLSISLSVPPMTAKEPEAPVSEET